MALSESELETAFVDLLGEPDTHWELNALINRWISRTGNLFGNGVTILARMIVAGTVTYDGINVELTARKAKEVY